MLPKLKVLFLCTGNSCRSQMAEAWARTLQPERIDPYSAGTAPGTIDPTAVRVMAEVGIDLSARRSKHVDEVKAIAFDAVVTVCDRARERCPVFPGPVRRIHAGFDDPPRLAAGRSEEAALEHYRRVRDEIRAFVEGLQARLDLLNLMPEPAGASDLEAVVALVEAAELSATGIESFFPGGYAIVRGDSGIAAVAGLENHAGVGLLRSVAVAASLRGSGIGRRLVEDRLAFASAQQLEAVYLLTTTAPGFFRSAGFRETSRAAAPAALQASPEFASICPSSAVCLVKVLRMNASKEMSEMNEQNSEGVRAAVREHYGDIAKSNRKGCDPVCCGSGSDAGAKLGYSEDEINAAPEGANLGLGCGNPQAIAALREGETVLDLGSGGGFDCFLAARRVGPTGHVIGVDMTAEMIAKSRANAERAQAKNVEFRLGEIERLPVADNSVDVILSNCVINLSPDKAAVFQDAFRVLRPGGRLAIADVVTTKPLPPALSTDIAALTGCVDGAVGTEEVRDLLRAAGFESIRIDVQEPSREFIRDWMPGSGVENYVASATIEAIKPAAMSCCGSSCCVD